MTREKPPARVALKTALTSFTWCAASTKSPATIYVPHSIYVPQSSAVVKTVGSDRSVGLHSRSYCRVPGATDWRKESRDTKLSPAKFLPDWQSASLQDVMLIPSVCSLIDLFPQATLQAVPRASVA